MKHPRQTELLEYLAGSLLASRAENLVTHLDGCGVCTDRTQALTNLRADFEGSWDDFLEEFRERITFATEVPAGEPQWSLMVRGILDGTRRLAAAATQRLTGALGGENALDAAFVPVYSGVGDPDRAQKAGRLTEEASDLCGQGDLDAAVARLIEASRVDPQAGSTATLNILHRDRIVGKIVAHAGRRSLSVLVDPDLLRFTRGSAVLIIGPEASAETRKRRLTPVEGAPYLLAEFEELPSGMFSVGLELY